MWSSQLSFSNCLTGPLSEVTRSINHLFNASTNEAVSVFHSGLARRSISQPIKSRHGGPSRDLGGCRVCTSPKAYCRVEPRAPRNAVCEFQLIDCALDSTSNQRLRRTSSVAKSLADFTVLQLAKQPSRLSLWCSSTNRQSRTLHCGPSSRLHPRRDLLHHGFTALHLFSDSPFSTSFGAFTNRAPITIDDGQKKTHRRRRRPALKRRKASTMSVNSAGRFRPPAAIHLIPSRTSFEPGTPTDARSPICRPRR